MKKLIVAALLAASINTQAQLSAFINGKEVKAGATVSKKDLASLQVSFKNQKKVTIISGRSVLYAQLLDADKKDIQSFFLSKDGYVAIDDFFKTAVNKKLSVFGEGGFPNEGNTLDWILTASAGKEARKNIQVKVGFYVVEETGYRQYGPQVQLLEPLVFNVSIWDAKSLMLPFLDLTIDKTNIAGDIDTKQNGSTSRKDTEVAYQLREKDKIWYTAAVLNNDKYPGLTVKEVADDFIHAGTLYANYNQLIDEKAPFKDYDIAKFTLPWDLYSNLLESKLRLTKLSYRVNKGLKKSNLMDQFETVTVNGLKGYLFKSSIDSREHINAWDWKAEGNFVIYILEHPTNPKLTLIVSSSLKNNGNTIEETDALLKNFINGIKK